MEMKIIVRVMKFVQNEMRKILADVIRNKNMRTDAYLYDMTVHLKRDLNISKRNSEYILHVGNSPICIMKNKNTIHILDMDKFIKIKDTIKNIGGTPKEAYQSIDEYFSDKKLEGKFPIAITIKR